MRRLLLILPLALIGIVLIVLVAIYLLLPTSIGQSVIDQIARPKIESAVASSLGSTINFAPVKGKLPGEIILTDISLQDNRGEWLSVEEVTLKWSPLAAMRGKIDVDRLVIASPTLHLPPPESPIEDKDEGVEKTFSLPDLPAISVERVSIKNALVKPEVYGRPYTFGLTFSGAYKAKTLTLKGLFATEGDTDSARIDVNLTSRRLNSDIQIHSTEEGILASLMQLGGPLTVEVKGNGLMTEWAGDLTAKAGAYGSINGRLSGDIKELSSAETILIYKPGAALDEDIRALMGDTLRLHLSAEHKSGSDRVTLQRLTGKFGEIKGSLERSRKNEYNLALSGDLSEDVLSLYGAKDLAGPFQVTAYTSPPEKQYDRPFSVSLETILGRITVREGFLSPNNDLKATLRIIPSPDLPVDPKIGALLAASPVINTEIQVLNQQEIKLDKIDVNLGSGKNKRLITSGAASFFLPDTSFSLDLKTSLDPLLAKELSGSDILQDRLSTSLKANGVPTDFQLTLSGQTPTLLVSDQKISPATFTTTTRIKNGTIQSTVKAEAKNKSYVIGSDISYKDGMIDLPSLYLEARDTELKVIGKASPGTGYVDATLDFTSDRGLKLTADRSLQGQAHLDLRREAGSEIWYARLSSPELSLGTDRIEGLAAELSGPSSQIAISLSSNEIYAADQLLLDLSAQALLQMEEDVKSLTLSSFSTYSEFIEDERRINLSQPAHLSLGDVLKITDVRLDWLGDGFISADAEITPTRWQGEVMLKDLTGIGLGFPLNSQLALDTDSPTRAKGSFSGQRNNTDGELLAQIEGSVLWQSDRMMINAGVKGTGTTDLAAAKIQIPMAMDQTNTSISIRFLDEDLAGTLLVDGEIESMLAMMPELPLTMTGLVQGRLNIGGRMALPTLNGMLNWRAGTIEDDIVGLSLRDINTTMSFEASKDSYRGTLNGNASDTKGKTNALVLTGKVSRGYEGEEDGINVSLKLNDAQLIDSPDLSLLTHADLSLQGNWTSLDLTGDVNLNRLDATIPSGNGSSSSTATYTPVQIVRTDEPIKQTHPKQTAQESRVNLDLHIQGDRQLFIRGRGLNSEWATEIDIGGTIRQPEIAGEITARQGTFRFAGRNFTITEGDVAFSKEDSLDPKINVSASYETDEIEAIVTASGQASSPKITLTSSPTRPQEDILALLLFGKLPQELSAFETLQIANAVAQLGGISPLGGGVGLTESLRSGIGLDALSIDLDPNTGIGAISVGKYVSDEVFVSARQTPGEAGTEINVTYELNDHVTIESTLKPNGSQNVSANYKRDY